MRNAIGTFSLAAILVAAFPAIESRGPLAAGIGLVDGLWVMQKVEDRYEGDDVQEDLFLTLSSTVRTGERPRDMEVRWLKKNQAGGDKLVVHFLEPNYAKGVTLLMLTKPYVDDERWLYFPDPNLIRRVTAVDEHTNFMGTDFTYYDLSEREPDEEVHTLLRIEQIKDVTCYVVETTPKAPVSGGYAKKVTWIDKDRFLKMRIQYFHKTGQLWKQYDPEQWVQIDGVWTPLLLTMENFLQQHKTVIKRANVRYNQKIAAAFFEPRNVDCVQYRDGRFALLPFEQRPTRVWENKKKASGGVGKTAGSAAAKRPG
ncbi:MAG TPA: outer membrane lipoprotein-sorting protein, partial [Candidatus Methanoperedens sp.]|nr:outer membrane lipoprotein-sorting protein [Candidatus Methanoperedens sp.]